MTLEAAWRLALAWYSDRISSSWQRKSADEAQALFAQIGLTDLFWDLGG